MNTPHGEAEKPTLRGVCGRKTWMREQNLRVSEVLDMKDLTPAEGCGIIIVLAFLIFMWW